jgi:hypothetical protein
VSDWWNQPIQPPEQPDSGKAPVPPCPWCGAPGIDDAETCAGCGASLTESEKLNGLAIPGVTVVDPELLRMSAAQTPVKPANDTSRTIAMRVGGSIGGIAGTLAVGAAFKAADKLSAKAARASSDSVGGGETAASFEARLAEADRTLAPATATAAATAQTGEPELPTQTADEYPAEYEPAPEAAPGGALEPAPEAAPDGAEAEAAPEAAPDGAEAEAAPEAAPDGAEAEPAPGGGYRAEYETPGVEFPAQITDEYPAVYEPASGTAAPTQITDEFPAEYEPASGTAAPTQITDEFPAEYEPAPGGTPASATESEPESASSSAPLVDQAAGPTGPVSAAPTASDPDAANRCPWCSAMAPADATHCPSCHASMSERDSIGDMLIPGVTEVDPVVVHRNDVLKEIRSIPGIKLSPTIGFGLVMVASLQQQAERRAEARRPIGQLGVPSAEAMELAAQLDRGETISPESTQSPRAWPKAPVSPVPAPLPPALPGPESTPAPVVDAWANVPWAGTGPLADTAAEAVEAAQDGEAAEAIEPSPAETPAETIEPAPNPEPWEDPDLAAGPPGDSPSSEAGQTRD